MQQVQAEIDRIYAEQQHAKLSTARYALRNLNPATRSCGTS